MQFHLTSQQRLRERIRGRAGRRGRDRPTDLGTSRHQGDPAANRACPTESLQPGPATLRRVATASPPFPRRPARGVLRLAPHDPRWADLSGAVPFSHVSGSSAYPPLKGLGRSIRAREADARPPYPCDPRLAGRDPAAWAAVRGLANPHHGHRPNRPDVSAPVPEASAAHLHCRLPAVPALKTPLESALGWDEVI